MRTCLNCQKEYQNKRESSKFCSDKCRVKYNRDNPRQKITPVQMQVLYNAMLELVADAKKVGLSADYQNIKSVGILKQDGTVEPLSFDKMRSEAQKPTYLQLLNGMANIHFADEKEEYAAKIYAADHLSQKQIDALINALRQKQ